MVGCEPKPCTEWCADMSDLLRSSKPARQQLCKQMCSSAHLAEQEAEYATSLCRLGMLPDSLCGMVPQISENEDVCMSYCESGIEKLL